MKLPWRKAKPILEAQIVLAADVIAEMWDAGKDAQVAVLRRSGFDEGQARRLLAFLPLAFSRPILEELGVVDFDPNVTASGPDGTFLNAKLMRQPEYVQGLKIARDHRNKGVMDHEVYKLIASSSADLNAVDDALNEGVDVTGATIATSLLDTKIAFHLIR
ncbi:hypothetical protein [Sphingopyxis sp. L1A2A]|uniref:hypothetical protein n=1 Tax=Sphingopyxis sp. L1A2A TaxID=2502247 RepID=UPI0010FA1130|nr:hypothetical protein [Sphingopyxis sp. L1A2A]